MQRQRVCDLCGDDTPAEPYVITLPEGSRVRIDLCTAHSEPLREIASRQEPQRPRRDNYRVSTLEEIERMKKGGRS